MNKYQIDHSADGLYILDCLRVFDNGKLAAWSNIVEDADTEKEAIDKFMKNVRAKSELPGQFEIQHKLYNLIYAHMPKDPMETKHDEVIDWHPVSYFVNSKEQALKDFRSTLKATGYM